MQTMTVTVNVKLDETGVEYCVQKEISESEFANPKMSRDEVVINAFKDLAEVLLDQLANEEGYKLGAGKVRVDDVDAQCKKCQYTNITTAKERNQGIKVQMCIACGNEVRTTV